MEDTRVARRYAQALFDTAQKYDVVQSVEEDLVAFESLLERDAEFRHFFNAPHTGRAEKIALMERVFSDRITALSMQLIRIMLQKGRERELRSVRSQFERLRREKSNTVHAVVTSAQPIDGGQKDAIIASLSAKLGKKVEADFDIDPRVIGGIKVNYGSYVLDGTVRGALDRLRGRLRHDTLKQA